MMMQRKILDLKDKAQAAGSSYFEQLMLLAKTLNDTLIDKAVELERLLSSQEQNTGTLEEKVKVLEAEIEIFQAIQKIINANEGDMESLLSHIPGATQSYLKAVLGLEWQEVVRKYLTADNLLAAINQAKKQKKRLKIVEQAKNEVSFAPDHEKALFLAPLSEADEEKIGAVLTPNALFHRDIKAYKTNNYSSFKINYQTLQDLSSGLLVKHAAKAEYFLALTTETKKALGLAETDPLVRHGDQEYLVIASEDKAWLKRKIFAAYLNAYEKAVLGDYQEYTKPASGKGVDPQEINDMVTGVYDTTKETKTLKTQKKLLPEDALKKFKLMSELAILKYNYRDVDDSEYTWQFCQTEAAGFLNTAKVSMRKKDFQELEKEIAADIKKWAEANNLDLPTPETAETARRRAAPLINIDTLRNKLRGLGNDPRSRPVLFIVLALLLVAGGGAGITHLLKNRPPAETAPEAESLFTRALNTVKGILSSVGQKLSELFADPEKTPQELRIESDRIIQDAKDKAKEAIQTEEPNLTSEESSEAHAETDKHTTALQTIADTYLQAREKADEAQNKEYDQSSYAAAGQTLADARAALDSEAAEYAEDDKIVRPLVERLSTDLQERAEKIQEEIERQEKRAEEAAEEAKARELAEAERQRRAAQNEAAEKAATVELENLWKGGLVDRFDIYIRQLDNRQTYNTDNKNTEPAQKLRARLINLLDSFDANATDQYFARQSISTNSAKLRELKLLEDCAIYLISGIGQLKWGNSEQNILRRLGQL
ncbi:MAG: hypothetical protein LBK68_06410 [Candidatus Margulisbacteria bacterium]|jgi:hypothetical protein|nr:hypothetical protein [Candidatus Margulisiibacteriota bacterium]